jgi:hypothetical protein
LRIVNSKDRTGGYKAAAKKEIKRRTDTISDKTIEDLLSSEIILEPTKSSRIELKRIPAGKSDDIYVVRSYYGSV